MQSLRTYSYSVYMRRVLVVDADGAFQDRALRVCQGLGLSVTCSRSPADFADLFHLVRPDIVIAMLGPEGMNGMAILDAACGLSPRPKLLVCSNNWDSISEAVINEMNFQSDMGGVMLKTFSISSEPSDTDLLRSLSEVA